ncbi:MAG: hypothetical protein ACI8PD_001177 [Nitrospinales bacterium]
MNDKIFISCGKFGVALKLPAKTLASIFLEDKAKPLKFFHNVHIKKEYAILPKHPLKEPSKLNKLIDISIKQGSN